MELLLSSCWTRPRVAVLLNDLYSKYLATRSVFKNTDCKFLVAPASHLHPTLGVSGILPCPWPDFASAATVAAAYTAVVAAAPQPSLDPRLHPLSAT
eukprot:2357163-Pleurochrysis_carterae.AAC.2